MTAVLAGCLLSLLLSAGPAGAHPNVASSVPAEGAHLDAAPSQVRLTFGAGIESAVGSIKVYDRDSQRVDLDDASVEGDGLTVVVSLRPDLPDGAYVIIWRAIGVDDGHLVVGQQHFSVGGASAGAAAAVAPTDATGVWSRAAAAVGAVAGAATVLAGGIALLAVLVLARRDERWRRARTTCTAAVRATCVVAVVASSASIPLGAAVRGGALAGALDPALLGAELIAPTGAGALARALLLLPLATGPLLGVRWYALGAPALAAATLALDGHTDGIAMFAGLVHVLVVAVWAGGLVALVISLRHAPRDDAAGLGSVLGTFSSTAAATVLVAGATGIALATATAQGPTAAVADTPWGQVLTFKTTLVVTALLLAAHTRFRLLPRLERSVRAVPAGGATDALPLRTHPRSTSTGALTELRRTTIAETVLVGAALVASGLLGGLDPAAAAAVVQAPDAPAAPAEEDCVTALPQGVPLAHDDCPEELSGPDAA